MYSLIPAQSGNPGMRSWQKSTNALFAAMTTGVVGHRVSSRSNVMTSTLDGAPRRYYRRRRGDIAMRVA
jgi:hypothetical protein